MKTSPDRLAYWYLRLNGFLTTENFIVHPDIGRDQRTDADLLAVRFGHRSENVERPMTDDPRVVNCETFANVIIAEVKTGRCDLNGPWTRPEDGNMHRVIRAIGCVSAAHTDIACKSLYENGHWSDANTTVRLFAFGEERSSLIICEEYQVIWQELIDFVIGRFREYRREKSSVGQWAGDGKTLQRLAVGKGPIAAIRRQYGLRIDGSLLGART